MAIVSKTDRYGVDVVIENLQQSLYPRLIAYWDVDAVYTSLPRANKNTKEDNLLPIISIDEKDYDLALTNDNVSVNSFWLINNTREFDSSQKWIVHDVSLIFQADLIQLYGQTNRADEEFNMNVLKELNKANPYMFDTGIEIKETVSEVYSDLNISGELQDILNQTDIGKSHVVRFDFEIRYSGICNIPSIAPVCTPATYKNSDDSFIQSIPSATTFISDDITITIDGTPNVVPSNTDQSFTTPSVIQINTANSVKTGDTTDGDRGRSRTVLSSNNPFGNTNTNTDTLGTQIYANDVVIDWNQADFVGETVLGVYRIPQTGMAYAAQVINAAALTIDTYSDWAIINMNEMCQLLERSGIANTYLNYAPYNLMITSQSERIYTSTKGDISTRQIMLTEGGALQNLNKTTVAWSLVVRIYTFAELGL